MFEKNRFEINDFLTIVKFGLNKFEMIILQEIIDCLINNKNVYQFNSEEWKIFTRKDNQEKESMI